MASLVTLALLAVVAACAPRRDRSDPALHDGPSRPVLGAYLGSGPKGTARLPQWQLWSGVPAPYGIDYLPADSWDTITGPSWLLDAWRDSGRRLVLSVPMLPMPARSVNSDGSTLEQCAAGDDDPRWRALGGNLIADRLADTIVRPGWEFNGTWYAWSAAGHERAFAGCFRRLVTVMRSVPGQRFTFLWNPTIGAQSFAAERAWPGDSYVDIIGLDVYDVSWQPRTYPIPATATAGQRLARTRAVWGEVNGGDHGLKFWVSFATRHGAELALPEWGLVSRVDGHGGGDDPDFVEHVIGFVQQPGNRVEFALYFDVDSDSAEHRLSAPDTPFPRSARRLRDLLANATWGRQAAGSNE
ncbi:glycosyl hydrolase [Rugosimonospora acidiphila]|uniref:glycosyl hydrolase n=1 Tax=Rugosimonospora acidiphila TaxID=556531 RepID=UPI0031EBACD3